MIFVESACSERDIVVPKALRCMCVHPSGHPFKTLLNCIFQDLSLNCDIELFSMDAMLIFLARESTTPNNTLSILLPYLEKLV